MKVRKGYTGAARASMPGRGSAWPPSPFLAKIHDPNREAHEEPLMLIPGLILKQMYTLGSLENVEDGVRFSLKNRLSNATLTKLNEVRINGLAVPLDRLTMELAGDRVAAAAVSPSSAIAFPLAKVVSIHV